MLKVLVLSNVTHMQDGCLPGGFIVAKDALTYVGHCGCGSSVSASIAEPCTVVGAKLLSCTAAFLAAALGGLIYSFMSLDSIGSTPYSLAAV